MNRHLLLLLSLLPWFFMAFHPGFSDSESTPLQPSVSSGDDDRQIPFQIFIHEDQGKISVSWFAPQQGEITHYVVERKDPGKDFFLIGGLNAAISEDRFEFVDMMERHSKGPFYYRVKICFADKSFAYSQVKMFAPEVLTALQTSPVSTDGIVRFEIDTYVDQGVLSVTTLSGTVVHQQRWQGRQGEISMTQFPAGVYLLEIVSDQTHWQAQVATQ